MDILEKILERHKECLRGYYYDEDKSKLEKSLRIICINKKTLNLDKIGRISFYDKDLEFIRVFNLKNRKNELTYFCQYYFFTKREKTKREKKNEELKKLLKSRE